MKQVVFILIFIIMSLKTEAQTSTFKPIDSLLSIGRYQKALVQLKKQPISFQKNKKIADIYVLIDNHKQAVKYYEKALELKDDYQIKLKLGKSYKKEKKLQKSISVFENIIAKDSGNLLVKYQLGKLYLQTKQPLKAKKTFKELILKDKNNANFYY